MSVVTVPVQLADRSYEILIGANLLSSLGARVSRLRPRARVAIITDESVAGLHLPACEDSLRAAGVGSVCISVPAGERSKSFASYEYVLNGLLEARIERGDLIIALGGGVIGDLAGFAAATLLRGVDFIQIPTTLLAQVDSSVGGKTGINAAKGKNLVGAFHQPVLVLADRDVLTTLPLRDFRSGYAEVVKYGLINDADFFRFLESNWREVFSGGPARDQAIATSCRAKAAIVGRDERESGERALLNLGHTFGHALEAHAGYSDRLLHGEAVSLGMGLAFGFSHALGLCLPDDLARMQAHLAATGLPVSLKNAEFPLPSAEGMMSLMAQDKKVSHGAFTLILARGIGQSFIARDVDPAALLSFLESQF